jgi:hypothetical protein
MRIINYVRRGTNTAQVQIAADQTYTLRDLRELIEDAGWRFVRLVNRNSHYAKLEVAK